MSIDSILYEVETKAEETVEHRIADMAAHFCFELMWFVHKVIFFFLFQFMKH